MFAARMKSVCVAVLVFALVPWLSAAAEPAEEAKRASGAPPGTQATALVDNVPPAERDLAGELIRLPAVRKEFLSDRRVTMLPRALRDAVEKDPSRYVSARPVGPKASTWVAVDVRGCQSPQEAHELAAAAAQAFAAFVSDGQRHEMDERVRVLSTEKKVLQVRLHAIVQEITTMRRRSPLAAMPPGRSLLAVKLEILTAKMLEAEIEHKQLAGMLKLAMEMVPAKPTAEKPKPDKPSDSVEEMLQELEEFVPEGTLEEFVPEGTGEMRWRATTRRAAPGERLTAGELSALRRKLQMGLASTVQRLIAVKEMHEIAKQEAADLEEMMARIRYLEDEAASTKGLIDKLDESLRKLQMELSLERPDQRRQRVRGVILTEKPG